MRFTKGKVLAIILAALLLAGSLAGCGGNTAPTESESSTISTEPAADESKPGGSSTAGAESSDASETQTGGTQEDGSGGSGGKQTTPSKGQTASTTQKVSTPTVVKPAFSEEKKEDMGGYTMTVATMWANEWESSKTNNGAGVRAFDAAVKKVSADYNATIKIKSVLPEKLLDDITKSSAAGDLYADVVELGPSAYYNLVVQKMLTPVNDLPELNYNDTGWISTYKDMTTYNGKFYGITWISKSFGAPLRKAMFFNKDLMEQYKQPDIYKMVEEGAWTWDAWESIMKDVVSKSSNKVAGVGAYDLASLSLAVTCSNNAAMYSESKGKFSYTGDSDNAVEAMDFMQSLVKEGLYAGDKEGFWVDTTLKTFTDGKELFYVHDYYAVDHIVENMKQEYGVVPFPKGPKANSYSSHYGEGKFLTFMAGNPNVKKAAKLIFALAKRTNDVSWVDTQVETKLCDEESGEMLKYLVNNPAVDCTPLIPQFNTTVLGTLTKIAKGEISPKAGLGNAKLVAQTNLNDFFKQK